ncbi:MAG: hypothetical protein A3I66_05410 [Burkholderiales bacterium RIFCSPLOWO2_02_FULL_57_36]|nr:MAG: hypothetical protein A3I66_05410 [Burkholderiales bacterium RIFCSPLOWO2_02_FULL_57_36]
MINMFYRWVTRPKRHTGRIASAVKTCRNYLPMFPIQTNLYRVDRQKVLQPADGPASGETASRPV